MVPLGQYSNIVDNDPSYVGDWRVRPEMRDELLADPLSIRDIAGSNAVVYNSDFLRDEDIEQFKTRQNAGRVAYVASGKIDIATTENISLTLGGSVDYLDRQNFNRANSLLNADNNFRYTDLTWRGFLRFVQRFPNRGGEDGEQASKIKNAFYSIQLDYSRFTQRVEDQEHGDKFFDYGYLGRFNTFRAPTYEFVDTLGAFVHTGFRDTLVTFGAQRDQRRLRDQGDLIPVEMPQPVRAMRSSKVERRTTLSMRERRRCRSSREMRPVWPRRVRLSMPLLMCWSGTSMYLTTLGSLAMASIRSSSKALGKV